MSVRNTVKSIQDIMRQDSGVDGDAQRISQLCWMFFLKIIDDQDQQLELMECAAASPSPSVETAPKSDARSCRCLAWRRWSLSGLAFRNAMNSGTFDALILFGLTISAFGTCAITMIGSNLVGSKPSFG